MMIERNARDRRQNIRRKESAWVNIERRNPGERRSSIDRRNLTDTVSDFLIKMGL